MKKKVSILPIWCKLITYRPYWMKLSHWQIVISTKRFPNLTIFLFFYLYIYMLATVWRKQYLLGVKKENLEFDLECRESRKILRQQLRRFCKSNCDKDRLSYSQKKRREYKELLRQKKKSHKNNILHSLQAHIKDPKRFWDTVRSVRPKSGGHSAITSEEWYNYFSSIFNSPPNESEPTAEDLGDAAFADNEMNWRPWISLSP